MAVNASEIMARLRQIEGVFEVYRVVSRFQFIRRAKDRHMQTVTVELFDSEEAVDPRMRYHCRDKHNWTNEVRKFGRIPVVSEYLALASNSQWYEVQLVIHTSFTGEFDAEDYAVEVDHMEVQRQAFNDIP